MLNHHNRTAYKTQMDNKCQSQPFLYIVQFNVTCFNLTWSHHHVKPQHVTLNHPNHKEVLWLMLLSMHLHHNCMADIKRLHNIQLSITTNIFPGHVWAVKTALLITYYNLICSHQYFYELGIRKLSVSNSIIFQNELTLFSSDSLYYSS